MILTCWQSCIHLCYRHRLLCCIPLELWYSSWSRSSCHPQSHIHSLWSPWCLHGLNTTKLAHLHQKSLSWIVFVINKNYKSIPCGPLIIILIFVLYYLYLLNTTSINERFAKLFTKLDMFLEVLYSLTIEALTLIEAIMVRLQ